MRASTTVTAPPGPETAADAASPASGATDGLRAAAEDLFATDWTTWARIGGAILVGLLVHAVAGRILRRFARREDTAVDDRFVFPLRGPSRIVLPLLALQLMVPSTPALAEVGLLRHALALAVIVAVTWTVIALVRTSADFVKRRHDVNVADNYAARRMHTQVNVISRVVVVIAVIVGIALCLMTFPRVRELGTSLLASAGLVGLVVGFAARPVLENLIGGVQLALTQPINIDDVVIVDGEWGRIEEITTTYVVVRIWDDRRLVCPFSKFITDSFQNWTRRTSDLLGTVLVHADYTVDFEAVRAELRRVVQDHPRWDGRVAIMQVTDATPETVEMRALVSAASAPAAWDLQVHVREKLIEFLQREQPEALPRTRVSLRPPGRDDRSDPGDGKRSGPG